MRPLSQPQRDPTLYIWILRLILLLVFIVLLARITELQVIEGSYYRALAEENRIRKVSISAPRGKILARGGEMLVGNNEIDKRIIFDPNTGYTKSDNLSGAKPEELVKEWIRNYPLGKKFAHVSGYLGRANVDEVGRVDSKCSDKGIKSNDSLVGRGGLEEYYDCVLRGIDGEELIEVDSKGEKVRILGKRDPTSGNDIKTTIDYPLQEFIAEKLEGQKGTIIVSDSKDEILALYSSPTYDPNTFINPPSVDVIEKILNDQDLPLFNRAISGVYHPGSTFKPVVALAGLEEGVIDKDYIYEDTGRLVINTPYGTFSYSNWYFTQYGGVEGRINLERALARSTDTFFYNLGGLLGVDKIDLWANKFGMSQMTLIDLPGEISGLVPSPEWKEKVKGERWFLGNTYHMSIGQGDIAVTPLELNRAITAIANKGSLCVPHLLSAEVSGNFHFPVSIFQCKDLGTKEENIKLVKQGMEDACSPGGTGFPFFDFKEKNPRHVSVACKTGTAETGVNNKTHAWFTAFAPMDKPEIIATVLVEEGGEGSAVAGPIARDIFDYWFAADSK
ncbi:hypothetical protein A3A76_05765 [Candidatus Woesebacteria bacterium RIFCSPLOWO2_01_FULL_39_23]|uniref:Penicillin-binding protein 2 n=1 Tax=Candidatus Woesebacteria bacterium RIFCSPHIGHO2_01_FULL_40_22 TaxID=1802499 RepID=A0A1F7YHV2_9BACT|nr:MAG: hypothetical protein A2141_02460 [Candidatus Woesebacteria bacterium RBG_16_40_11]OGM26907.1 MAG: hypothetical protein A2628_05705 [Candidatus Woesebacteria bacterium RIFCSPHIGHO2_01_FULL_40_22]OGM38464.1 MAG: hypothetical protein A3E41_01355 [Candidatus Woesebacteria bacterium RIFCSPHIGHO2_12_FULL_38_9]OGM63182.1 MAG: hypothetical protein A3A76_05765 [Candidatus Woesebacteria bacterium RIFCSPLOWO2_01_FULL_39_23]